MSWTGRDRPGSDERAEDECSVGSRQLGRGPVRVLQYGVREGSEAEARRMIRLVAGIANCNGSFILRLLKGGVDGWPG